MSARAQPRPTPDMLLLAATLLLLGLGVEMVYSASFVTSGTAILTKQATMAAIGLVVMVALAASDYHWLERFSLPIMAFVILLLLVVTLPGLGNERYGANRWLRIPLLPEFQPSELAKLGLVIYMASWMGRKGAQVREFSRGFIPFAAVLGFVTFLIMIQPDMGTSFVVALTATCVFFVAGANLFHFLVLGLVGVAGFAYLMVAASYRLDRFMAFLNPWQDPQGTGFHTIQTLIALGSGGVTGLGLGASRQKFYYVPGAHTDAIFAIIGEELGLVGATGVILLFCVIAWRGFVIAVRAPDRFGRLLATGITCAVMVQALTNIAVVTNTVPYTGITLPLVSYGGSSLVVTLASVGVLLSVSRYAGVSPSPARVPAEPRGQRVTRVLKRRPLRPPTAVSPVGVELRSRGRTSRYSE